MKSGYGTFAAGGTLNENDYVTAARTPDGKLAIAYVPETRTITVDMRKLSGRVSARWYDPTNGTSAAITGVSVPQSRREAVHAHRARTPTAMAIGSSS